MLPCSLVQFTRLHNSFDALVKGMVHVFGCANQCPAEHTAGSAPVLPAYWAVMRLLSNHEAFVVSSGTRSLAKARLHASMFEHSCGHKEWELGETWLGLSRQTSLGVLPLVDPRVCAAKA